MIFPLRFGAVPAASAAIAKVPLASAKAAKSATMYALGRAHDLLIASLIRASGPTVADRERPCKRQLAAARRGGESRAGARGGVQARTRCFLSLARGGRQREAQHTKSSPRR